MYSIANSFDVFFDVITQHGASVDFALELRSLSVVDQVTLIWSLILGD